MKMVRGSSTVSSSDDSATDVSTSQTVPSYRKSAIQSEFHQCLRGFTFPRATLSKRWQGLGERHFRKEKPTIGGWQFIQKNGENKSKENRHPIIVEGGFSA